ncbi:MAG: antibiotic biosynthesis monooxygenase [Candidatus Dormibacterales bacterium]
MAEHAGVIDVSRYYPAPGRRGELLAAMQALAAETAAAEGCFGAQACASDLDEDALVAISRWESDAALEAFADSPDFVREREGLASLLARPAGREHYRPL